mgnify:CR=1 FL=1
MKRILLKLSGESLMGEKGYGIDEKRLADYATQIQNIANKGVQIGIVIGADKACVIIIVVDLRKSRATFIFFLTENVS